VSDPPLRAGVVGVGCMGENHARVYDDIDDATLAGVFDVSTDRATAVADRFDTRALSLDELAETVDIASIAVPTAHHYDVATTCIRNGVDVLVEKPFVADPERGRDLIAVAEEHDATVQVGHVERFNPAVETLRSLVDGLDIVSVTARRLGPPPERDIADTAVMDLMIHDIDVVLDLVDESVASYDAFGTAGGRYATAALAFDSAVVGHLTASRVTQETVRELTISAADCRVKMDYMDQSVELHRATSPEYLAEESDGHYHHENVVERLSVDQGEPLANELRSFVDSVVTGSEPVVTAEEGLTVLELTQAIDRAAATPAADAETADDGPLLDARLD
jgi:predicted dehydrogenase